MSRFGVLASLAFVVGSVACGPPPDVLSTQTEYSERCRTLDCGGMTNVFSGALRSGSPPLDVACFVSPDLSTIRFRVYRGGTSFSSSDGGLFVQGRVVGSPGSQSLNQGCVDLRFRGSQSIGVPVPGMSAAMGTGCEVGISEVSVQNNQGRITGRIRCFEVMDDLSPPRAHIIEGTTNTGSLQYGDFSFRGCTVMQFTPNC